MPTDLKPLVLILEDQEYLAELIARVVESAEAFPMITLRAEHAIDYMENPDNPLPELIVLDIGMPGMSGWDFLDIIKQYEATKTIPVIVTTAHGDAANRLVGKLRDVDRYMVKPYQPEDLRQAIIQILNVK
jgi:two-component system catabolic regulation response regulator CreB